MESLLIYVSVFLITYFINVFAGNIYERKKILSNILIIGSFLILLIFVGGRYYVGTDYESYINMYNNIASLDFNELNLINIEIGAKILFKVIYLLFDNQYFIFIGLAFLTLYPLYKANKLYNYKYLGLSILTYCFMFLPFSMNGMRQGVAMSFVILSFANLFKDKKINMVISFVLAFLFHKSSILILPYLIIFIFEKNSYAEMISIVLTLVITILLLFFNNILMSIGIISDYEYLISNLNISSVSFRNLLLYLPFLLIMISYKTQNEKHIDEMNGLVISGLILNLIGTMKPYLTRISHYHLMVLTFLMPVLIQNINNKTNKTIIQIFYIIYLIIFFTYEFYITGMHEIFPYQSWLIGIGG